MAVTAESETVFEICGLTESSAHLSQAVGLVANKEIIQTRWFGQNFPARR